MSRTESLAQTSHAAQLIGALFDEVVVPLAEVRRARGAPPYFPREREAGATTYLEPPRLRAMRPCDYALQGGTSDGLLHALATLWAEQGDAELAEIVPRLREIARALAHERQQSDGTVDVLCYTLF